MRRAGVLASSGRASRVVRLASAQRLPSPGDVGKVSPKTSAVSAKRMNSNTHAVSDRRSVQVGAIGPIAMYCVMSSALTVSSRALQPKASSRSKAAARRGSTSRGDRPFSKIGLVGYQRSRAPRPKDREHRGELSPSCSSHPNTRAVYALLSARIASTVSLGLSRRYRWNAPKYHRSQAVPPKRSR